MFSLLTLFGITFGISFVASAQPGPVNLSVIQATLHQSRRAGFWLALGGCIPELLYGGLVAYGSQWFDQVPGLQHTLRVVAIPALLLLGALALWRAYRAVPAPKKVAGVPVAGRPTFLRGLLTALLNPQLPLFWFFVLVYYSNYPWLRITSTAQQLVFAFAAATGAFTVLNLYVALIHRRREKLSQYLQPQRFDLIMGCGLIGLALWRAVSLI